MARLAAGAALALVSDAGTPLISDPGFKLVREAAAAGIPVTAVPGASALLAALTVAGLPTDRFLFVGFLPAKSAARRRALREIAAVKASLVLYETAPRLGPAREDMAAMLGDRPAAVARELTKFHEEVRRDSLKALAERYKSEGPPKGEMVVIVGPPAAEAASEDDIDSQLVAAIGNPIGGKPVAVSQRRRHPRVLAENRIGAAENVKRAQGNVAQVSDRRRNNIKAGRKGCDFGGSGRLSRFTSRGWPDRLQPPVFASAGGRA